VFLRQRKDACCPIAFISVPRAYLLLSRVLGSFWMFFFYVRGCHEEKDW